MKKTFLILALIVGVAAHADYLYWMVNPAETTVKNFIGQDVDLSGWTDAKLFVNSVEGSPAATMTKTDATFYSGANTYAIADIGTSYSSFIIELWNGDNYLAYTSATSSALANYIYANNSMSSNVATAGWGMTAQSYAVPEPTSGLLFLVGGMLLGLKRRRQV